MSLPLGLTFHRNASKMMPSIVQPTTDQSAASQLLIQSSCFAFQTNNGSTKAKTEAMTQKFPRVVKS